MCGDVILVSIVFLSYFSAAILCITMYFVFSLSFSVFLCLLVCQFLFLVASFDGLRPLLITSHCSLRSLANKLRSFVPVNSTIGGDYMVREQYFNTGMPVRICG